jgi:hypothetical protein
VNRFFRPATWTLIFILVGGLCLRALYSRNCWHPIGLTFADADCYTRMARVRQILEGHGLFQRFHSFENFPQGIQPHTTFPLDGLILLLYTPFRCLLPSAPALDWSGALISPVLFLLLSLYLWRWSRPIWSPPVRWIALIGLSVLPSLVWATPFARPDHQSLLLLLVGLALSTEWKRWEPDAPPFWSWFCGLSWGLAFWTSWFEPALIFAQVLLVNVITQRREQKAMGLALAATLAAFFIFERWHVGTVPADYHQYFWRWLGTIGEAKGLGWNDLLFTFALLPSLLIFIVGRLTWLDQWNRLNALLAFAGMTLTFLSFVQSRWLYFAAFFQWLVFLQWLQLEPRRWKYTLVVLCFALAAWANFAQIHTPQDPTFDSESRIIAQAIKEPGAILAPWWISPSLLYFSGQPIVASSSHQSLPGTVTSARFFTTKNWTEADEILQARQVRYVVVYEMDRLLENSSAILGLKEPRLSGLTITERLWQINAVPSRYRLLAITSSLRLYEYLRPGSQSTAMERGSTAQRP